MPSVPSVVSSGTRKDELKQLFKLAFPTMITQLLRLLNPSISIMVCGHLSREELDASSLATTLINVLGISVDTGFATAFDTLFSQAYGSRQRKVLGLILQRALCVVFVMFSILVCIHVNIGPILLLLKQDPLISSLTAEYLKCFLPGLACDFLFLTFGRYLQAQNIVLPMLYSSCLGTLFNVSTQYLFVVRLNLGLRASALCLSSSFAFMLLCELIYLRMSNVLVNTWPGLKLKTAFSHWGIIFRMGIPGVFMVALEEWCFEMITFIAGTMDEVTLGAHAVAFQIQSIIYMVPLGIFTAVNIRVGQRLGAFDPTGARFAYTTAMQLIPFIAVCTAGPVILLRNYVPHIFTEDMDVCHMASKLLPLLLLFQFCEGFAGVSEAVLLACGRQSFGAIIIFVGYYCVGMPLAFSLAYRTNLGLIGAWLGLLTGFGITTVAYTVIAARTNWTAEARQAHKNVTSQQASYMTHLDVKSNGFSIQTACSNPHDPANSPKSFDKKPTQSLTQKFSSMESLSDDFVPATVQLCSRLRHRCSRMVAPRVPSLLICSLLCLWIIAAYISFNQPTPVWRTQCTQRAGKPNASVPSYCERMSREDDYFPFSLLFPTYPDLTHDETIS